MVSQPLREKLAAGRAVIGPLLQEIPNSPELVEFIIAAGFDYVIIDGEHGGVSVETCRSLVRAAESMGGCALARVPNAEPARILAFLDQGVQGIILAHCRSTNDAEALVRAVKYPPRGIRGAAGGSRAASYGYARPAREHVEVANANTLCFGLIEDPEGVPEVKDMLRIDGFDGCFLGAGDMTLSMSREYFGNATTHPEVQRMIDRVREETLAAGKYVMAPAGSGEAAKALLAQGVQLVVVQFGQFLRTACNTYLRSARDVGQ
ncbi:MAG: siderophore biosynthesis protein SbnG [Chloroflexi bacterium]|nr:siderophore biosynthesis protein SbnG [Chloroflexota bacterium]